MGLFSRVHADVEMPCPTCRAMGNPVIQFTGDRIGDELRWEANVVGAPGNRRVLVSIRSPAPSAASMTTASTRWRSEVTASSAPQLAAGVRLIR